MNKETNTKLVQKWNIEDSTQYIEYSDGELWFRNTWVDSLKTPFLKAIFENHVDGSMRQARFNELNIDLKNLGEILTSQIHHVDEDDIWQMLADYHNRGLEHYLRKHEDIPKELTGKLFEELEYLPGESPVFNLSDAFVTYMRARIVELLKDVKSCADIPQFCSATGWMIWDTYIANEGQAWFRKGAEKILNEAKL